MGEITIDAVAVEYLGFFLGVIGRVFSIFAFWWIVYVLFRFFIHNVVYKDDEDGWKLFSENIRRGVDEFSVSFYNVMSAIAAIAKQWAAEKKEELELYKR